LFVVCKDTFFLKTSVESPIKQSTYEKYKDKISIYFCSIFHDKKHCINNEQKKLQNLPHSLCTLQHLPIDLSQIWFKKGNSAIVFCPHSRTQITRQLTGRPSPYSGCSQPQLPRMWHRYWCIGIEQKQKMGVSVAARIFSPKIDKVIN